MKKYAIAAIAAAGMIGATPALAGTVITSVQIRSANPVVGQQVLQIAELQLFSGATNVALAGTATATSTFQGNQAVASNAIDGSLNGVFPAIFHSADYSGNDIFTLTLSAASEVDRISIFGRTDECCGFRDIYSYTLLNGSSVVGGGVLDARVGAFATAAVPEPATWGMLVLGFGMVGFGMRRRKSDVRTAVRFA